MLSCHQNTLEEATVLLSEFEAQEQHNLHSSGQPVTPTTTTGISSNIRTDKHVNNTHNNTSNMDDIDG